MKKHTCKILLPIIFFLVYALLDYVNIPSTFGIVSFNLNMQLFGIVLDATIVITLYMISFYYIDNRQNEKDNNAQDTVGVIFEKTYNECLENLILLDNRTMVKDYIIPKIDGNKTDLENKIVHNLQSLPFSTLETVLSLATNGHISKSAISDYLEIKKEYQYLVSMKITFFDLTNPQTPEQIAMYNSINDRDKELKNKLKLLSEKYF